MSNNGKRVAWVTGGGSGIGESGAEHLAADGWTVVVSGRRKEELDRVVAKHHQKGRQGRGDRARRQQKGRRQQGRRPDPRQTRPDRSAGQQRRHQCAEAKLGRHGTGGLGQARRDQSQRRALLHARGAAGDAQAEGRLHHQRRVLGRPPRLENAGPGLHHDQACGAGADPFLQHGRMRQRPARLLPVARRGRDADPEIAPGGAEGGRAGQDAAAGRLRPHHRLRRQHAAARLHERDPDQPDHNRGFIRRRKRDLSSTPHRTCECDESQTSLVAPAIPAFAAGSAHGSSECDCPRRFPKSFRHHDNLFVRNPRKNLP